MWWAKVTNKLSIGSGLDILLISEPWLGAGSRYTVGHLIHQDTKSWNEELVWYIFEEGTAQRILNIPLFQQVNEDRLVWNPEKNGHYSVRSAYRLCVEEIVDNSHLRRLGYWSRIWRLKVPPKIKNMVWHVCRECLSTRVRLNRRGVNCPSSCVMCNDHHEYGNALSNTIQQMNHLESLNITALAEDEILDLNFISIPPPNLRVLNLKGKLTNLPDWIPNLKYLVKLRLGLSNLEDDPLESLTSLPSLLRLNLWDDAFSGKILHFKKGGFPKLKELDLTRLNSLSSISID